MNLPSSILSLLLLTLLLLSSIPKQIQIAHARPTFTTSSSTKHEKYDRSISTFSNEGRLLQVEYSTTASTRSKLILTSLEFDLSPLSSSSIVCVFLLHPEQQPLQQQDNTILKQETTQIKIHRITPTTLLFTTGLKGDGRILAKTLRYNVASTKLGVGEDLSTREIAERCGRVQHELTWRGGARPLGVSATLIGVDDDDDGGRKEVNIYQCDPGGVVHPYSCCIAGGGDMMNRNDVLEELIALQMEFKHEIQQHLSTNTPKEEEEEERKEKEDDVFCNKLLTSMVQKIGHVLFHAASSSSSSSILSHHQDNNNKDEETNNDETTKEKQRKMDVWVIQPAATSSSLEQKHGRKGALIRYATDVTEDDLLLVSKRLFS